MDLLTAWLKSKSVTSHTVAAAALFVAGIIVTDQAARNFVLSLFEAHPRIGTMIVSLAGIILKYSHSSSAAGTVAYAKVIESSPNPPTPAAVEAATIVTK